MRFFSHILLISFVIPVWLSGQVNAQAINVYDEYKAGKRTIKEIVINNNLEDKLIGYSYCGYFIGQSLFLIIKEGNSFFEVYQGEQDKGILNTYKFELTDKRLSSLFAWTKNDEVIYNIQSSEYFAIYYYFVLYDKNHNEKLEFNISTMAAYKNAQKSRKLRKLLPFTKEQQKLFWKLAYSPIPYYR